MPATPALPPERRLEPERSELEATATRELKVPGESLRARRRERATYHRSRYGGGERADARDAPARVVRPLAIGLSLSAAGAGGVHLLWTAIEWSVETLAALNVDIEQARQTLTEIGRRPGAGSCGSSTGRGSWCCRLARRTVRSGPWAGDLR